MGDMPLWGPAEILEQAAASLTVNMHRPKAATCGRYGVTLMQALRKPKGLGSIIPLYLPTAIKTANHRGEYFATIRIFYAEWYYYLGPSPFEAVPPAQPFVPHRESLLFISLFPYGVGHYVSPSGGQDFTFEQYVVYRLGILDTRFQTSSQWLKWVLVYTEDREVIALVNLVLVGLHDLKARHLGKGMVQDLSPEMDFEEMILVDSRLVLDPNPIGRHDHIEESPIKNKNQKNSVTVICE